MMLAAINHMQTVAATDVFFVRMLITPGRSQYPFHFITSAKEPPGLKADLIIHTCQCNRIKKCRAVISALKLPYIVMGGRM